MAARFGLGVLLSLATTACFAATDLGVPWADLPVSLNVAASRVNGQPLASNGTCDGGRRDPCRWTTPDGLAFEAQSDGAGHLGRIEADLSTDDHPRGATAFRAACSAIVALVHPRWSRAQAFAAVSRTMALTALHGSVDERRQVEGGVILFGDRNTRSEPARPDGAFLQCGASPDF